MEDKTNVFSFVGDFFVVPSFVSSKLSIANEIEIKTALFFCANKGLGVTDCANSLGVTKAQIENALSFWRGAGIELPQKSETKPEVQSRIKSAPDYDGKTLADLIASDKKLPSIIEECQKLIGKSFTPHDTEIFVGVLYDWLGLSPEYILTLTSYCCEKGKKNVRYIEKTALSLVEDGVDDFSKLESFIGQAEKKNRAEYKLRKLFGFGDRALTAAEKKHFSTFCEVNFPLLEYAYEIMIKNIGTVRLAYMSKILNSWKDKGVDSVAKAKAEDKKAESRDLFTNESFDFDDFLSAAIKKGSKKKGKEDGKK